jgi:hypothetical protein
MNNCIEQAWSAYVPGGCWEALEMHYDRWVVTKTSPDANAKTYDVQCNLLIGQLLIDGTPLKRLPPDYIAHPTYLRTFDDVRAYKLLLHRMITYFNVHLESIRRLSGKRWHALSVKEKVSWLSGISSLVESPNNLLTSHSSHFLWSPQNCL